MPYAEHTRAHITYVLEEVADAAKDSGVLCELVQVEQYGPHEAIIAWRRKRDALTLLWHRTCEQSIGTAWQPYGQSANSYEGFQYLFASGLEAC